jgi:rSAM/selenodomain-associated transferase 2
VISLIIPTFNEELSIGRSLASIARVRGDFEVIVADGSSTDATVATAQALTPGYARPLRIVVTERNRAIQQNRAAKAARGEVLVFLHADTLVPPDAMEEITSAIEDDSVIGGNFDLIFEGRSWVERFFTWAYRVRRPFGIYYGDSGIFVRRCVFESMGGFKPLPIMDDYEFVRRLERRGRTVCLETSLITSDRRWRVQGLFRTLWSWVWIQTFYSVGVPARYLARWYKPVRAGAPDLRESVPAEPPASPVVLRPNK